MSDIVQKTAAALAGFLEGTEQVLAAAKAQLEGNTMRTATSAGLWVGLGGVVGAVAGSQVAARGGGDLAKVLRGGAVLAVTETRLVVLDATKVGANPKEAVLAIDRAAITGVSTGSKRVALVKMMTVTIATGDDGNISFEIPKVGTKDAQRVVEALTTR